MTVSSGFFNSVNHDRLYDAEQLSSIFDGIIVDGVYENYGEALNVTAYPDANSTVIVGTGRAWFDHTWTLNDSRFSITLDPPNELLGRTDSIVIDIDKTQSVRKNSIIYVKGSESTPDLPPTLINTDLHKQYPICYVNRPAGSNKPITQSDITITVGTSVCPMVTGILEAQNLENLMQQLDDEFNTWWDGIKDTLDENTVTNLQNQINEIKEKLDSDTALVGLLEKPIAETFMAGGRNISIQNYKVSNDISTLPEIGSGDMRADPSIPNKNTSAGIRVPSMLLPDGKCLSVIPYMPKASQVEVYRDGIVYRVIITDTNGISRYHDFSFTADTPSDGDTFFTYYNGSSHPNERIDIFPSFITYGSSAGRLRSDTYIPIQVDVYPVRFSIIMKTKDHIYGERSNSPAYLCCPFIKLDFVVTSQGVVTCSNPYVKSVTFREVSNDVYEPDFGIWFQGFPKGDSALNQVNTIAYKVGDKWYCTSMSINNSGDMYLRVVYVLQINSDGTISKINYTNMGTTFSIPSAVAGNTVAAITDEIDGEPFIIFPNGYSLKIDENSLNVSAGSSGAQFRSKKSLYSASSYTLSETSGVSKTSIVIGENGSTTSVKKSNFFLGANNSGDGIPNGTFSGVEEDGRLYGVESSTNHLIAIGTNGGAAMQNRTFSGASSFDMSRIQTAFPGEVTHNGSKYNLYIPNSYVEYLNNMGQNNLPSISVVDGGA